MDQLVALWAHSTSSFRWPSLRSSPSAIRCAPGIGPRPGSVPNLHKRSVGYHEVFCTPGRRQLCPVMEYTFTPGLFDLARRPPQLKTVGSQLANEI